MTSGSRRARISIGLLLVLPAVVMLWVSYGAPTVWTVRTGWGYPAEPRGFGSALWLAAPPLLTILVIAPLLAFAAHRAGRPGRWLLRLGLAVPMVCFAPAAFAAAWLLSRGREHGETVQDALSNAGAAESTWLVRLATWTTTFGLVCGVGVTLYLAALRAREPGRPMRPTVLTVGALAAVAVVAASLQTFAYPLLLAAGRPHTPMVAEYQAIMVSALAEPAAAQATLLLGVLAVLGLLATAVVILSGLRMEIDPLSSWLDEPAGWRSRGSAVVVGLGTAAVLGVTAYGLWPWLTRLGRGGPPPGVTTASVLANTWLPPVVSAAVGVGVALVAGFGIGALRPLGRWSEALLLPFAPWLFVGLGPLSLAGYDRLRGAGQLNTFIALIPPTWVAIPALVIFTVLFRGLAATWPRIDWDQGLCGGAGGWRGPLALVRTALPMVILVFGATVLVNAQGLCWPRLVSSDAEHQTGPVLTVRQLAELPANHVSVELALPVLLLLIFAVGLGALQVFFLDRVTLRTGGAR